MTDSEFDRQYQEMIETHQHEADWSLVLASKPGTILLDRMEGRTRFVIMRSHFNLTAYLGVPREHPLAGCPYNVIQDIPVHGGWTYAGTDIVNLEAGWWWFGWDYAHAGDYVAIAEAHPGIGLTPIPGHQWTVPDVERDSRRTILEFQAFALEREN